MPRPSAAAADNVGLVSVSNALRVLNLLSDDVELRVVDVARSLDVGVSTAHRLMATMVAEGYLRQAPGSRRYIAGSAALRLAREISTERTLRRIAEPHLQELCRDLNETINLQILIESDVYFLASVEDQHRLRVAKRQGHRQPAHTSAGGKVMLAFLPEETTESILQAEVDHGILSPQELANLKEKLAGIHADGYAVNLSDLDNSVRAVAVPVTDDANHCIAALSLAAPTIRLPDWRVHKVLPALVKARDEISTSYAGRKSRKSSL